MAVMNPSLREMRDALSVGEEFVNRYNKPGPRYTSYPTAPVWTDSFGPKDFEDSAGRGGGKAQPGFALHASSLLRKPVPVLRLQRGHHEE